MTPAAPTILLVDDEELFRMTLKDVLHVRMPGVNVLEASDGAEALDALAREHVDCVVSDLAMPVMDGVALLAQMHNAGSTVPVVVVSAYANDTPPLEGTLRYFVKPVDLFGLVDHVAQVVRDPALSARSIVTLLGLLHVLAWERRSCSVRVGRKADGVGAAPRGSLTLRQGELVRATCRAALPSVGVEAAIELLQWDDAVVSIAPDTRPVAEPSDADIPIPLGQIAARAIARRRHKAKVASNAPPSTSAASKSAPGSTQVARLVDDLMAIDGVVGATVVDTERCAALGARGASELGESHVVGAARDLVSGQATALRNAGVRGSVHEMLLTLERQMHLLRPMRLHPSIVVCLACDRARAALPVVRMRVEQAEQAFDHRASRAESGA